MTEEGMTDLQFKSYIRLIANSLEDAKARKSKEETDKKLDELLEDLRGCLQSQNVLWRTDRGAFAQG